MRHHQPTDFEYEQRIELTLKLLRNFQTKGDIKSQLRAKFGVRSRTVERYLSRARARLLAESNISQSDAQVRLTDKLTEIIRSDTSVANRIRAIEAMARIHGLFGYQQKVTIQTSAADLDTRRQRLVERLIELRLNDSDEGLDELTLSNEER